MHGMWEWFTCGKSRVCGLVSGVEREWKTWVTSVMILIPSFLFDVQRKKRKEETSTHTERQSFPSRYFQWRFFNSSTTATHPHRRFAILCLSSLLLTILATKTGWDAMISICDITENLTPFIITWIDCIEYSWDRYASNFRSPVTRRRGRLLRGQIQKGKRKNVLGGEQKWSDVDGIKVDCWMTEGQGLTRECPERGWTRWRGSGWEVGLFKSDTAWKCQKRKKEKKTT